MPGRQVPGNAVDRPEEKLTALDAHHYVTSKPKRWEHDLSLPFDFRDSAPAPGQKSQVLVLDLGHGGGESHHCLGWRVMIQFVETSMTRPDIGQNN